MKPKSEVFNTDCLEYMRTLPGKAFQLAIADPPYGINAPNMKMGENKGYVSTATKCKKGRLNSGGGEIKEQNIESIGLFVGLRTTQARVFR